MDLGPSTWFVRSNGGSGSYPVTPEGWRVVRNFLLGIIASVVVALVLSRIGPTWLWLIFFAAGAAMSAWYFIDTARKHTDYSVTYNEYVKANKNA